MCKKVKIICICAYAILFLLTGTAAVELIRQDIKASKKPNIQVTNSKDVVQTVGDNNDVTVVYIEAPQIDYDMVDAARRIFEIHRSQRPDDDFTFEEALDLSRKIVRHAKEEGLSKQSGYIIVYVESDFCNVVNRFGATGYCQITPPCLNEFNDKAGRCRYTMVDMKDPDKNLEVGFWYYNRLMTYYADRSEYGLTTWTDDRLLRDAYIAYNIGVTTFKSVGKWGRNELRSGRYPRNMYGARRGDPYTPALRYFDKRDDWGELS